MICGFSSKNMTVDRKTAEDALNLTKDQQDLLTRIMEVGKDKGREIDTPNGLRILSFLSALAEICVSLKMLQERN